MLILGEILVGPLMNSGAVSASTAERVLAFISGAAVRRSERPIARATSPLQFTGVDCPINAGAVTASRAIGTVASQAVLTDGHVLQASAFVAVRRADVDRRLPWSHYLSRPGTVETIGKNRAEELAVEFPSSAVGATGLDLGAVCRRVMDTVQRSAGLDQRPPFKVRRTTVRWSALLSERPAERDGILFTVEDETTRTIRLECGAAEVSDVVAFCEDLALHDWLLTALQLVIERARIGVLSATQSMETLRPAVDHLLHLWMPDAGPHHPFTELWQRLEGAAGFDRQWQAGVQRIRDYLALSTMALLSDSRATSSHAAPVIAPRRSVR